MPSNVNLPDDEIYVRQEIEAGIADADAGRTFSTEEVRRRFNLPPAERAITPESLVAQITYQNRHDEIETGERVGNEVW
jgi:antitoxin component of MazEF toxin-antitoxin module